MRAGREAVWTGQAVLRMMTAFARDSLYDDDHISNVYHAATVVCWNVAPVFSRDASVSHIDPASRLVFSCRSLTSSKCTVFMEAV
jgi:hypothetical protein